jgi:cytoskeletal protein CcmA (bactofilin family)
LQSWLTLQPRYHFYSFFFSAAARREMMLFEAVGGQQLAVHWTAISSSREASRVRRPSVNYFSTPKSARELKPTEVRFDLPAATPVTPAQTDVLSTFGHGMVITGNIVCAGALQIFGRVSGEIHAAQLTICEGAKVEGKVVAQDTIVQGEFKGTIHGNTVKLQSSAVVDGEIFNRSLTIEQNAQFEGVSRRLDRPINAPALDASATQEMSSEEARRHLDMALKDIVA